MCSGEGLAAKTIGLFVNLFGGWALFGESCLGFFEEEEVVVPDAESLLGALESGGERGGGLGGFGSGFGDVAGGLAGFADGVELVVVLGIEGACVLCEPSARDVDEFAAAEVDLESGLQRYLQGLERPANLLLIFFEGLT